MGQVDAEDVRDPEQIYLAASLREARSVEALLMGHGVEYAVVVEELGRTTLFGAVRHGACFYVSSGQAAYCRSLLTRAGMGRGVIDEPADSEA